MVMFDTLGQDSAGSQDKKAEQEKEGNWARNRRHEDLALVRKYG